jgi:putative Mg2+ transporter-C (MgtC) family protein
MHWIRWVYSTDFTMVINLLSALAAGSLIGLERSFHGRAAGFRTHALVSLASSLLMLLTAFQSQWLPSLPLETLRTDPTRMAQGIMTGIGFLGAGVIYKEGLTVRGLTTAGSIWLTAAIGILFGIGFYFPAILATVLALLILSVFRWIEIKLPAETYSQLRVGFARKQAMTEAELHAFLKRLGFLVVSTTYSMKPLEGVEGASTLEYSMVVRTNDSRNATQLAQALVQHDRVATFHLTPVSG